MKSLEVILRCYTFVTSNINDMDIKRFIAPTNKAQLKKLAADALDFYNPEELLAVAVRMEAFASELRTLTKGMQLNADALDTYGIKAGETTRYDYSNSPAYVYLIAKLDAVSAPIKAQIKDVENLAKMLAKVWEKAGHAQTTWTDPETGEVFDVKPAIATSSPKFELK